MILTTIFIFCVSSLICNVASTGIPTSAVVYEDRFNNYLVLKLGNYCYFWKTTGQDAQSLQIQSAQRTLEERLIQAVQSGASTIPFTPLKTDVSFVIVNSCRNHISVLLTVTPPPIGR